MEIDLAEPEQRQERDRRPLLDAMRDANAEVATNPDPCPNPNHDQNQNPNRCSTRCETRTPRQVATW